MILGIDRNYLDVYGYQVTKGRGLTDKDYSEGRKVALIDKTTAASLFDNADVIGRTIEIKGEPFVVVGMVAKKAESQPVINSMEDYYRYMSDDQSGKIIIRIKYGRSSTSMTNRRTLSCVQKVQMI